MNSLKKYKISDDSDNDLHDQPQNNITENKKRIETNLLSQNEKLKIDISNQNNTSFLNNENDKNSNLIREIKVESSNEYYHQPQIIDEDVENFKRKLEILVTNFKTDSLKDFMTIKRNILGEQRTIIETEKKKCDSTLTSKNDEIEHLKEKIAQMKFELNKQLEIKDKLSFYYSSKNQFQNEKKMIQKTFLSLKRYYILKKNRERIIQKCYSMKRKSFNRLSFQNLKTNYLNGKIEKIIAFKDNENTLKINEISRNYQKEISELRKKQEESKNLIEKYQENKQILQDNLKKALYRGVLAMNMEAMSILEPGQDTQTLQHLISQNTDNFLNDNNLSNNRSDFKNIEEEVPQILSFEVEPNDKKIRDKDYNWLNASSIPTNIKNNLIVHEDYSKTGSEQFSNDFENYPRSRPKENLNQEKSKNLYEYSGFVNQQNYVDELSKNMSFLKNDVESKIYSQKFNEKEKEEIIKPSIPFKVYNSHIMDDQVIKKEIKSRKDEKNISNNEKDQKNKKVSISVNKGSKSLIKK